MTRVPLAVLAIVVSGLALIGCAAAGADSAGAGAPGGQSAPTPSPEPSRDPAKDSLPLVADVHLGASSHTWQGADDHVTLSVDNRGRDIQDLVIQSSAWVVEHGLAMGSTQACLPNTDAGVIDCGPIFAGQSASVILRAMPAHVGTFQYELRIYDREGPALLPLDGTDGRPAVFDFVEVVDPLTNQVPGGTYTPSPSPSG